MSTRALRRLRGKQRGQEALDLGDLTLDDQAEAPREQEQLDTANVSPSPQNSSRKTKKSKAQKNFSNIYELVRCRCIFIYLFLTTTVRYISSRQQFTSALCG